MGNIGFNQSFSFSQSCGFGNGFSYSVAAKGPSYTLGVKNDGYFYPEGSYFNDDPHWFNYHTPTETSYPISSIEDPFNGGDPPDHYSRRWTGYFKAPTTETYTFYLNSDDASYMWIGDPAKVGWNNDNALISNGGTHGPTEVTGSVALVAGNYYPIQVFFGEASGGSILTFSYSTDTISKTSDLTGLIYYSPNLDPFLRGIENKTSTTLISSGSIVINGNTFSWPTFDVKGPDPAGWNTLLTQGPLQKVYAISGAGSLGGPSQAILDFIGRGDLPTGTPLVCSGSVSATGSLSVGDYGIRTEAFLGTPGVPAYSFTDYLGNDIHAPGGSPPFTWAGTYNGEPPDSNTSFVLAQINPIDRDTGDDGAPAQMIIFVAPPPASSSVVTDHLELWFDSRFTASYPGTGTSWTDMKNGIVATLGSGVTFDSVSGTMVFDGGGGAVASTPNYTANLTTGYTLESYVRWDGLGAYDGVIAYNEPPRYANVEYIGGGIRFEGAGVQINDGHVPALGTFYHYVATWDGSNNRLYRDGVLVAGPTGAVQPQSATHTAAWVMGQWDAHLNGAITMTRLYSKALSGAEVLQNYNTTLNPNIPPPPPVPVPDPYFKWDPANYNSGDQTVPDTGTYPYNNKLHLQNGVTVGGSPAMMSFGGDGSSQYGYTVTATSPGPFTFSIGAWVKTPWTARKILGFEGNQVGEGSTLFDRHMFVQDSTGLLGFGVYDTQDEVLLSTTPVNDNSWHHCVVTCDFDPNTQAPGTGTVKLYVDGVLEATKTASPLNYGGYWRIGSYAGWPPYFYNGYYNGSLGIVEVYDNVALTGAQVAQLWTNQKTTYGL